MTATIALLRPPRALAVAGWSGGLAAIHGQALRAVAWGGLLAAAFWSGSSFLPSSAWPWLFLGLLAVGWGKEKV